MRRLIVLLVVAVCGTIGFMLAGETAGSSQRAFTVVARQYGYDPPVIRVNRGDTVTIRFASVDVVHGFYLEGHDLDVTIVPMQTAVEFRRPSAPGTRKMVEEVTFTADRAGKFRYRCSQTCGFMHPFMLGELIVGPNRLLTASLGMAAGILLGSLASMMVPGRRS